jgi:hypothetical protein
MKYCVTLEDGYQRHLVESMSPTPTSEGNGRKVLDQKLEVTVVMNLINPLVSCYCTCNVFPLRVDLKIFVTVDMQIYCQWQLTYCFNFD